MSHRERKARGGTPRPIRWDHPEAAPLRAPSLAGAAPALVMICQYDPLRDEGAAYATRLLEVLLSSGCDVHLTISGAAQAVLKQELNISVDLDDFDPASLMLDAMVWGKEPFGYHLTSVALHAVSIQITHPVTRQALSIEAPYPEDFSRTLEFLRQRA